MIRAIIFDLDGTLVDCTDWHFRAFNIGLLTVGWPVLTPEDHAAHFDGLPTRKKLAILSERGMPTSWHDIVCRAKQRCTLDLIEQSCKPDPRHIDCLQRLLSVGYKLALASNAVRDTVDLMIAKTTLGRFFDVTLSNEDVKVCKPDPEIYRTAARLLGVHPAECLVAEDNAHGIKAAKDAGCRVWCVTSPAAVGYDLMRKAIKFQDEVIRCSTSSCPSPAVAAVSPPLAS